MYYQFGFWNDKDSQVWNSKWTSKLCSRLLDSGRIETNGKLVFGRNKEVLICRGWVKLDTGCPFSKLLKIAIIKFKKLILVK